MTIGRIILSLVAVFTGIGAYVADWNATHIYNPNWPPHAKFHNAQTMVLASVSAAVSLWLLLGRSEARGRLFRLDMASLFASLYWVCLLPGIFFPGTAFYDADLGGYHRMPSIGGFELNQAYGAVFFLILIGIANRLERRRLRRTTRDNSAAGS
ncbi:MAG: DUF6640 family protein [Polyangia bacterium]